MKNTISILGCGWLGKPLAKHLIELGFNINGSTTSSNKLEILNTEGITPYLINIESLNDNILKFLNAEILIINITSKNIDAYQSLINYISKSSVKKILFISSTSVYDLNNGTVTEKTETNDSLLAMVEKLFLTNNDFKTSIIRFGGLMGYDRQPGRFFKNGKIVSQPEACINYIHRDDCIEMISQIIDKNIWGEIFNGVTDSHPSKREFYSYMAGIIGATPPLFENNDQSRSKLVTNEKVKSALNFEFKHSDLMHYTPE